jgi:hypothetical protein
MATSAERNESPPGTGAPRNSEVDGGVNQDDLRTLAERGYEGAMFGVF